MGHTDGQGIGRIGWRCFGQPEDGADHEGNLVFLRSTASDHGLLDQTRCVFMYLKVVAGGDKKCRAASRTEDDGGADVLHKDDALDGKGGGLVDRGSQAEGLVDFAQALVRGEFGRVFYHAVGQSTQFAPGGFDHRETGAAEGRINGENTFGGHEP